MTENDNIPSKYYCFDCNKKYSTYKTLWKHKKLFHKNIKINVDNVNGGVNGGVNSGVNVVNVINENIKNNHNCLFCNKAFNSRQSKYQHKKYCKFRKEEEKEKEKWKSLYNFINL